MKHEYIECECGTPEHNLRFTWDPEWEELFVEVFLSGHYGFFKRLWFGIKYIFGFMKVQHSEPEKLTTVTVQMPLAGPI